MKNQYCKVDMEISEVEAMISTCIAAWEALEDGTLLEQRPNFITLFYIMRQKLKETLAGAQH